MAHEALDRWIDGLAPFFKNPDPPKLIELSAHFTKTRAELFGACMRSLIEEVFGWCLEQEWAQCPGCGRNLHRKRLAGRRVSTIHGEFELERPYFYCSHCRCGFHPLDEVLGLAPEHHQYDIQERAAMLAAELPFDMSAFHFRELTGIDVGGHFTHETLNAVGEAATLDLVLPGCEEIERRIRQAGDGSDLPPVLVVASDGAHMPTRPRAERKKKRGKGEYKEAKGFRLYLLGADERIVQLAGWHQVMNAERFTEDLAVIAGRIPKEKVRTVLLGDGAEWVWNAMERSFPEASQVLDYYHCSEHVYTVAEAQYGPGLQGHQWAESVLARLSLDMADSVIAGMRRMKPSTPSAKEEIDKLIGYLQNHQDRFNYRKRKKEGMPIGSGGIESANKSICHTRLKRPGAWWLLSNGNTMLRVRCAIYNGTFDTVFQHYTKQNRRQK